MRKFLYVILLTTVFFQTPKAEKYSDMSSELFDSAVEKNINALERWENAWRDKEFTLADDRYNEEHEFPGRKPSRSQEERAQKKMELDARLAKIPGLVRPMDADELLAAAEALRVEILNNRQPKRSADGRRPALKLDTDVDSKIDRLKNKTGTRKDLYALLVYMRKLRQLELEGGLQINERR